MNRQKRKTKKEVVDLDKLDADMRRHYGWLLIKEAETEKRMYDKAIRMDRKRRKQTKGWVV